MATAEPSREPVLTERQRQILDLLVAGKTNAEIAEATGLTFSSAKWHVSELLARIDVDTREEAAEWWRRRQGKPSRFRLGERLRRLPAMIRFGVPAGALAAAVVVALAFLWPSSDGGLVPLPPGMLLVGSVPADGQQPCAAGDALCTLPPTQLTIFGGDGRRLRTIGRPAHWTLAAWSPDARTIAGFRGRPDDDQWSLLLFDVDSGRAIERALPSPGAGLSWNADSDRIAVWTAGGTWLLRTDGTTINTIDDVTAGFDESGRYLLAWPAEMPAVFDRDGQLLFTFSADDFVAPDLANDGAPLTGVRIEDEALVGFRLIEGQMRVRLEAPIRGNGMGAVTARLIPVTEMPRPGFDPFGAAAEPVHAAKGDWYSVPCPAQFARGRWINAILLCAPDGQEYADPWYLGWSASGASGYLELPPELRFEYVVLDVAFRQ